MLYVGICGIFRICVKNRRMCFLKYRYVRFGVFFYNFMYIVKKLIFNKLL